MVRLLVNSQVVGEYEDWRHATVEAFDRGLEYFTLEDLKSGRVEDFADPSRGEWFANGVDYVTLYGDEGDMDL